MGEALPSPNICEEMEIALAKGENSDLGSGKYFLEVNCVSPGRGWESQIWQDGNSNNNYPDYLLCNDNK